MRRAEVYDAGLSPTEGSEQAGSRPVLIVSRDAINLNSPVMVIVPLTRALRKRRLYPSHVRISKTEGGLTDESIALCEQIRAIDKRRLVRFRGTISPGTMARVDQALRITLDLD
ncbi:MAG: type II toxin-antitoxin system PemK/MazF family toxin [Chloroflexi bacterium]|nr:type II toxin-antitoxin system PemK/MazF family toxin [Chloroflexota bacterium]